MIKQVAGIGKGHLNLCKAYWNWVGEVADNHKIPENRLNKMIGNGKFKTPEDAERATKRTIKSVLAAVPIVFMVILVSSIMPKLESGNQSAVVQPTDTSNQAEQSNQSSSSVQTNEQQSSQNFRDFLPPESAKLKEFILADPWLNGYLYVQNIWIGHATTEELLDRGFSINTLYKYTRKGTAPVGETKGACSPIGFDGAFICGRGIQPYQWGIQNDETIRRLNILEEEWAETASQLSTTPEPIASQATNQPSFSDRIIQAGDGYANLRSQPSTEVGIVAKRIPNGTSVKILEERTNSSEQLWYRVQVNNEVGWVYSGLLN